VDSDVVGRQKAESRSQWQGVRLEESALWGARGSVLGPILFLVFINNLHVKVALLTVICKFVDDTTIGQVMRRDQDQEPAGQPK
jgi:hypothetical protein